MKVRMVVFERVNGREVKGVQRGENAQQQKMDEVPWGISTSSSACASMHLIAFLRTCVHEQRPCVCCEALPTLSGVCVMNRGQFKCACVEMPSP